MEGEGQLLTILTFLIFGAVLVPLALEHATWKTVSLAILYLSLIRMLPGWLSLSGTGLSGREKVFLGWFGPTGLASVLFALLILERFPVPGADKKPFSGSATVKLQPAQRRLCDPPCAR